MRAEGTSVGLFRPITLWPFPGEQLEAAAASAKAIGVFELNAGQMIDDVKLNVPNRRLVRADRRHLGRRLRDQHRRTARRTSSTGAESNN